MTIMLIALLAVLAFFFFRNRHGNDTASVSPAKKGHTVEVVKLKKTVLEKTILLPGNLLPYEAVDIYAKVAGFIETINADRGTEAKKDDLLVQLVAPELIYRLGDVKAQYKAANDLYQRNLKLKVPVVSALEMEASKDAAEAAFNRMHDLEEQTKYLAIRAPFDGVITTRYLHTGAFVIPGGNNGAVPIFRIETIRRLRLVVPVPEAYVDGVTEGAEVQFTVPAFQERRFSGKVARISHSLELRTRTEPVELDVNNENRELSPGMYADIHWPVKRPIPAFTVPVKALVTTTERTFVIRIMNGITEWVDVKRGNTVGDRVEIFGELGEGDSIVVGSTDELKPGKKVDVRVKQDAVKP